MWSTGNIAVPSEDGTRKICHYWVKHFSEPSETYGIDGGRISKLTIKVDGEYTLNYDRGWDIEPEDEATQMAFAILMKEFN